jgi:hypothetical protein
MKRRTLEVVEQIHVPMYGREDNTKYNLAVSDTLTALQALPVNPPEA